MSAKEQYFEKLGIDGLINPNPSNDEIKKAFRNKALELHPDKNLDSTEEAKKDFQELQSLREEYEKTLSSQDQFNNETAANKAAAQAQRHENHRDFSYEDLLNNVNNIAGDKGKVKPLDPRPAWVNDNADKSNSNALKPADHSTVAMPDGKYQYDREFDNGKIGVATLDITQSTPSIAVDYSSSESIEAGVELAQAAGWPGLSVPNNLPQETRDEIQKHCEQRGLEFSTRPANNNLPENSPAAAIGQEQAESQIEDISTPSPGR